MKIIGGRLSNSEFYKNVITVFSGTIIAQAITLIATPVLAKWFYGPKEFGVYGTFLAIVTIVASVASGKYENAIMLPKENRRAYNIVRAALLVAGISCLVLFVLIVCLHDVILSMLSSGDLGIWLYFIPIAVMCTIYNQVVAYWYIRKKNFKSLSTNRIVKSSSIAGANLGIGIFSKSSGGLVVGNILGNLIASTSMFFRTRKDRKEYAHYKRQEIKILLLKYIKFPQFVVPAELMNTLSAQMPIFVLLKFFGSTTVGAFSFVISVLGMPINLLAGALLDVFKEKANEEYRTLGNCKAIYLTTLKHLLLLSAPVFLAFFLLAPTIFDLFFGSKWEKAGEFARILSLMYFFKFISSPLSYTFIIANKMKEDFLWHIYILISLIVGLIIGAVYFKDERTVLWIFSINFSVIYSIYLIRSYSFAKGNNK